MAKFTKILPFIVLSIALASLYLQYKAYEAANSKCPCKEQAGDEATGPVV